MSNVGHGVAAHGSLPPVPLQCAWSSHQGWCLARLALFILQGGVSSVAFLSVLINAIFSLSCAMSAASAATHVCQMPDPAQQTCSPHHRHCQVRAICCKLHMGGCFGCKKGNPSKNRERQWQGLRWLLGRVKDRGGKRRGGVLSSFGAMV